MALTQIQLAMLADGILTADAAGRLKMADGFVNDAKIAGMAASKLSGRVPAANAPVGSVVQVVQGIQRGQYKATWSGWNNFSEWFNASITPQSASNKILIMVQSNRSHDPSMDAAGIGLYKNNSLFTDAIASSSGSRPRMSSAGYMIDIDNSVNENIIYLDSPATTSAIKYSVGIYQHVSKYGGFGIPTNDADAGNIAVTINTITLMEIVG